MTAPLIVKSSISIDAPLSKVWDALVNPAQTKKYMFGCEALSDWLPGSPLLWQGNYEGQDLVFVKGSIVKIEPERLLAYTTIDPNNPAMPDLPENYVTVTYRLTEENGKVLFSVEQGDFAHVADGEKRYLETYNGGEGWNPILVQIKALVEAEV